MATWGSWKVGDKASAAPSGHPSAVPERYAHAIRQPARWRRNLVLALLIALGGWVAWSWQGLREEALVGTAYAARTGCECRFVSGRSMDSCEADLKAGHPVGAARLVSLSEDGGKRLVTASVPLLGSQSADFRPERGCQLESWQN